MKNIELCIATIPVGVVACFELLLKTTGIPHFTSCLQLLIQFVGINHHIKKTFIPLEIYADRPAASNMVHV